MLTMVKKELDELVMMYQAVGPKQDGARRAFDHRWIRLRQDDRKALVDRLLVDGLLPEEVRIALEMFHGTVERLI